MIRVLHVLSSLGGGGVEQMLLNYYSRMERTEITFDFIVHSGKTGVLEKVFEDMGCRVYHVTPKKVSIIKNLREINKIISENTFDVIHCHQNDKSWPILYLAKKHNITMRISHSHNAMQPESFIKTIERKLQGILTRKYATKLLACSQEAAEWVFGKEAINTTILKNAINTSDFAYSLEKRKQLRTELGVEENFVIGNVGRLNFQKNQRFLLEIFASVVEKIPTAVLLIIGDGNLYNDLVSFARQLHIDEKVKFLGVRNDVADLYSAMDVFLFPTLFEGLGMVVVEAQTSGLKCFISDKVPHDAIITDNTEVISLGEGAKKWADRVCDWQQGCNEIRFNTLNCAAEHGYDINKEYEVLEKVYLAGKSR